MSPDHLHEWFNLRRLVRLDVGELSLWVTTSISEVGAEIALTQAGLPTIATEKRPCDAGNSGRAIPLQGQLTQTGFSGEFPTGQVFDQVTLSQQRRLVEMLFCRPGQWKRQNTPGELQSLWLLLKILLRPRVLFDRNPKQVWSLFPTSSNPDSVNQVTGDIGFTSQYFRRLHRILSKSCQNP